MSQIRSSATAKLQALISADVMSGFGTSEILTLLKFVTESASKASVASLDVHAVVAQKMVGGEIVFTVGQESSLHRCAAIDAI